MKLYIATKYQNKDRARAIRARLLALAQDLDCPLEVNSRWLDQQNHPDDPIEAAIAQAEWAVRCEADVKDADMLLVLTEDVGLATGGMHVETGIALNRGMPIFMLGPLINVFHYHPQIRRFSDETLCLAAVLRAAGAIAKRAA